MCLRQLEHGTATAKHAIFACNASIFAAHAMLLDDRTGKMRYERGLADVSPATIPPGESELKKALEFSALLKR